MASPDQAIEERAKQALDKKESTAAQTIRKDAAETTHKELGTSMYLAREDKMWNKTQKKLQFEDKEQASAASTKDVEEDGLNYRQVSRKSRPNRKRLNKKTLDAFSESQGEKNTDTQSTQKSQLTKRSTAQKSR